MKYSYLGIAIYKFIAKRWLSCIMNEWKSIARDLMKIELNL